MKIRLSCLALCALLFAAVCGAQVRDGTVEISPFVGYLFGGTFVQGTNALFNYDVDVQDHMTYGGRIGYNFSSKFEAEAQFSRTETAFLTTSGNVLFGPGGQKVGDLTIDYLIAYSTFNFGHGRAVPYVTLGFGAARLAPNCVPLVVCQNPSVKAPSLSLSADYRFTASLGGGLKFFVNRNFGFRIDGRYYATSLPDNRINSCNCNGDRHDWLSNGDVNGGLILAF